MPNSTAPLRVLVRHHDAAVSSILIDRLVALGHSATTAESSEPASQSSTAATVALHDAAIVALALGGDRGGLEVAHQLAEHAPDLAVILMADANLPGLSVDEVQRTNTMAVFTCAPDSGALDATVRLAVQRARELAAARRDALQAREQLEARKLIERAKGILMRRTGTTEQEAYRIMQRTSQDKSVPMVNIAKTVIDSEPGAHAT